MTPQEIKDAVSALAKEIGPKAYVSLDIKSDDWGDDLVMGYCRTSIGGNDGPSIVVYGNDWQPALDKLREEWSKISAGLHSQFVRNMALEIIKITAEIGRCHNAALRTAGFSDEEIELYGSEACDDADKIASNGPFSILEIAGANAA